MHDTPTHSADRLDEIIGGYLRAQEQGNPPPRDELLRQHPDLAEELREFFANHDRLNAAAGGLPGELPRKQFVPPKVRYFGDYELLDEIARGGMGVVYRAKQTSLNRIVAIKMILSGHLAGEEDVKRFRTEAEAAANLKHPGIVPVHEVGVHEGHHYFSMDYIEGRNLAEIARENPLPARKAAGYVRSIAEAVYYAHQQGTLHRDLKPSNILIDAEDHVHVTDFGLAVRVEGDSELTRTGQILGTPAYMPPEQAQSKRGLIGPASDVYALGAILYELLTGRPPFRGESAVETLKLVIEAEPVSPRLLNPKVPRDLETICLKCLQKEPHKRYATAEDLSEELRRFLEGEPILARPVGRIERAWRWCRRKPAAAGMLASIVLLVVGVIAGALWYVNDRGQQRLAELQRKAEESQRLAVAEAAEASRLELVEQRIENALEVAQSHREQAWTFAARTTEWGAVLDAARAEYRQAAAEVAREGEKIDPELRTRVGELDRALTDDELDQQLAVRCEKIFLETAEPNGGAGTYGGKDLYRRQREAVESARLAIGETEVAEAAARLSSRPEPVQRIWINALDTCLLAEDSIRPGIDEWLKSVLLEVDSDPWRNDVRAALVEKDMPELQRLAEQADVAAQRISLLLALAYRLRSSGCEDDALSLLLRAQSTHSGDFWVNTALADTFMRSYDGGIPSDRDSVRAERAVQYYTAALAVLPDHAITWSQLGIARKYAGDLEGAERAYRRAIDVRDNLATAWYNLGILLSDQKRLDEAVSCYREALQRQPGYAEAWDNLGNTLSLRKDFDGAIEAARTAIEINGREGSPWVTLGVALRDSGDLPGAVAAFETLVSLDPSNSQYHFNVADLLGYMGETERQQAVCRQMFDRFSQSDDPADTLQMLWAHLLIPSQPRPEVLAIADQLPELGQRDFLWLVPLAHYRRGDESATFPLPDQSTLEAMSADARICHDLALALVRLREGRQDETRELIRAARRIQESADHQSQTWRPWDPVPTLWREVAAALQSAGLEEPLPELMPTFADYLPALQKRFRQAIEEDGDTAAARLNLGRVLLVGGDVDAAFAEIQRATEIEPGDARAWARLGEAYARRGAAGDAELATAALLTAIELEAWNPHAQANLSRALRRTGDPAGAMAALSKAYELLPDSQSCRDEFVRSCLEAGEPETAVAAVRRTLAREQVSESDYQFLYDLLRHVGDLDGCRAVSGTLMEDAIRSGRIESLQRPLMMQVLLPAAEINEEALAAFRQHVDPNAMYHLVLGLAHYRRGEDQQAREQLRWNFNMAPPARDQQIMTLLAQALVELRFGTADAAEKSIRAARSLQQRSPLARRLWHPLMSLWREVQAEIEERELEAAIAELPPTCAELVIPDDASLGPGDLRFVDSESRPALGQVVSIAISDDGNFAYSAAWDTGSINVFRRDSDSGGLTHLQTIAQPDRTAGAACVRLSRDNRLAATAAFQSDSVLLWRRDSDGKLVELDMARDRQNGISGLDGAIDVAFSANGDFLYVITRDSGVLTWFRIGDQKLEARGALRGEHDCFANARGICVSPDGAMLYVGGAKAGTLTVLSLDQASGEPEIEEVIGNNKQVVGLAGLFSVTCSGEGRFIYTNSGRFGGDDAVCVFERVDGKLKLLEVHRNGLHGIQGLGGGNELVISPDGRSLYALGTTANAIACFDRDAESGRLQYRRRLIDDTAGVGPLGSVSGIAVSPDGRHVYVAAEGDRAISIFDRR